MARALQTYAKREGGMDVRREAIVTMIVCMRGKRDISNSEIPPAPRDDTQ
jgi:hypothetical protein